MTKRILVLAVFAGAAVACAHSPRAVPRGTLAALASVDVERVLVRDADGESVVVEPARTSGRLTGVDGTIVELAAPLRIRPSEDRASLLVDAGGETVEIPVDWVREEAVLEPDGARSALQITLAIIAALAVTAATAAGVTFAACAATGCLAGGG